MFSNSQLMHYFFTISYYMEASICTANVKTHFSAFQLSSHIGSSMEPWEKLLITSWLKELIFSSQVYRCKPAHMIQVFKLVYGIDKKGIDILLSRNKDEKPQGHNYKLRKLHVNLKAANKLFRTRLVNAWYKLPYKEVNSKVIKQHDLVIHTSMQIRLPCLIQIHLLPATFMGVDRLKLKMHCYSGGKLQGVGKLVLRWLCWVFNLVNLVFHIPPYLLCGVHSEDCFHKLQK